jgi:hypothetical protein
MNQIKIILSVSVGSLVLGIFAGTFWNHSEQKQAPVMPSPPTSIHHPTDAEREAFTQRMLGGDHPQVYTDHTGWAPADPSTTPTTKP